MKKSIEVSYGRGGGCFFSFLRIDVISTYTRGYRGVLTLDGFQVKAPL